MNALDTKKTRRLKGFVVGGRRLVVNDSSPCGFSPRSQFPIISAVAPWLPVPAGRQGPVAEPLAKPFEDRRAWLADPVAQDRREAKKARRRQRLALLLSIKATYLSG